MNYSGEMNAIIAGIFGVIVALAALLTGGIGRAFKAEGASLVIGRGWGVVLLSFLTITFGAVSMGATTKTRGVLLILNALAGIVLGGTLVAIFIRLSPDQRALAVVGAGKSPTAAATSVSTA